MSRIPENIKVILRPEALYNPIYGDAVRARAGYVIDASSRSNVLDNAVRLGSRGGVTPEILELPNSPHRLKLIGMERRSEGGRAWKVVTAGNWLFDLREDQLVPLLVGGQLGHDAVFGRPFIWGCVGSQRKLLEYNGTMHRQIVAEMEERARNAPVNNRIPASELAIGSVYEAINPDGWMAPRVYLGRVRHDGKLRFAFVELNRYYASRNESKQALFDYATGLATRPSRRWTIRGYEDYEQREPAPAVVLLNAVRGVRRTGDVNVFEGTRERITSFQNGNYDYIRPEEVVWA